MQFVPRNFIVTKVWQIARQASQTCTYHFNAQLLKRKRRKKEKKQCKMERTFVRRETFLFIVFQYSPSLICASETA